MDAGNSQTTVSRALLAVGERWYPLLRRRIFAVHAPCHHLRYKHDRDKQGDGHGRVHFGDAAGGDRPDRGGNPGCGALQTRTSQESATSMAGHAPDARLVTPQAVTQAGTKSPA